MVKTRKSAKTKQPSPKIELKKPLKTKKIDENKVELCEKWIKQQKKDVFKIPPPPIETLHSDSSSDETELIETRMNLYSVITRKKKYSIIFIRKKLNYCLSFSK